MNKVILIGNVTKDAEVHTTAGGVKRTNFTLAVNRKYKNAQGVRETDFIQCVGWRETAEFLEKYVQKGKKLAIVGELQTRNYETQDGQKRYVAEVIVGDVEFLSAKNEEKSEGKAEERPTEMTEVENDQDLPF